VESEYQPRYVHEKIGMAIKMVEDPEKSGICSAGRYNHTRGQGGEYRMGFWLLAAITRLQVYFYHGISNPRENRYPKSVGAEGDSLPKQRFLQKIKVLTTLLLKKSDARYSNSFYPNQYDTFQHLSSLRDTNWTGILERYRW